jgi:hypothetical protein
MFRLDYISCLLTILSTVLIGRRSWHGWLVAGANSVIVCVIGFRTGQIGFIPANIFCLAIYAYNVIQWRAGTAQATASPESASSDTLTAAHAHPSRNFLRMRGRPTIDAQPLRDSDRVSPRRLRRPWKSRASF